MKSLLRVREETTVTNERVMLGALRNELGLLLDHGSGCVGSRNDGASAL